MTDYAATQLKAIFLQVAGGDISVMEQSLGVDSDTVVWEQLFLEELKIPYILQHIVPKNRYNKRHIILLYLSLLSHSMSATNDTRK